MSDFVQGAGDAAQPVAPERVGVVERNTTETKISLRLHVDGQGSYAVSTGIRFFDHMLELS
jgi:imidazoleglycerol-phosphate dehydratase